MTKRDMSQAEKDPSQSGMDGAGMGERLARPEAVLGSGETIMNVPVQQEAGHQSSRTFFPCNREDILLQLASLVFSAVHPSGAGMVAVREGGLALLTDGLRSEEAMLLSRGQPARFPILVELRDGSRASDGRPISIDNVLSLRFRNQQEADDFRFRPVDEFDPSALSCVAEPGLFGLAGAPRFENRSLPAAKEQQRAHLADRLTAGICHLLELGEREPSCWDAVADLLCLTAENVELQGLALRGVRSALTGAAHTDSRQAYAVLNAFVEHEHGSSRSLIENLYARLQSMPTDAQTVRAEERWVKTAHALLQNQISLDGTLLSDAGAVPLRAALLAANIDSVDALPPFLHNEKPAGYRVLSAAAFLIGLKTGIAALSWTRKHPRLDLLTSLINALQDDDPGIRNDAMCAFETEPEDTPSGSGFQLFWKDRELAHWSLNRVPKRGDAAATSTTAQLPPSDASAPTAVQAAEENHSAASALSKEAAGDSGHLLLPDGKALDLFRNGSAANDMVTVRYRLKEDDRLRKDKEILEAACMPGLLWRVGRNSEGVTALYADLPIEPDNHGLEKLNDTLKSALKQYLTAKKTRKRSAKSAAAKTSRKSGNPVPQP